MFTIEIVCIGNDKIIKIHFKGNLIVRLQGEIILKFYECDESRRR